MWCLDLCDYGDCFEKYSYVRGSFIFFLPSYHDDLAGCLEVLWIAASVALVSHLVVLYAHVSQGPDKVDSHPEPV